MSKDLSIIIQGPINAETTRRGFATSEVIRSARALYPEAEIIYSGWKGGVLPDSVQPLVDQATYSVLVEQNAVRLGGRLVRNENTSRQLVSTVAGVRVARRPFVLKLRSDCMPTRRIDVSALHARALAGGPEARIVATKNYTRVFFVHEGRVSFCPMHISDLIHFGTKEALLRYWDGPAISDADFIRGAQPYTAEQVLCWRFMRNLGRERPAPSEPYLVGAEARLLQELRLLDRHFLFVDADELGVCLPERFRGKWFERHLFLSTLDIERMLAGQLPMYRRKAAAHAFLYRINALLHTVRQRNASEGPKGERA